MSATANVLEEEDVHRRVARIEALVEELGSSSDPATRSAAEEVIRAVLDLHGAALDRMLGMVVEAGEQGQSLLAAFVHDDVVSNVLLLHSLHPVGLRERVEEALESVRPYMRSHGGGVELLDVAGDVVRLQLQGSCHGCPSSAMTLKLAVEKAIMEAAPDVTAIEVVAAEGEEQAGAQPLIALPMAPTPGAGSNGGNGRAAAPRASASPPPPPSGMWEAAAEARTVGDGEVRVMIVSGLKLVVCRLGQTLYAFEARCPACAAALDDASLVAGALTCPSCGHGFGLRRAGRTSDGAFQLTPLPLLEDPQSVRIAIPTPVR